MLQVWWGGGVAVILRTLNPNLTKARGEFGACASCTRAIKVRLTKTKRVKGEYITTRENSTGSNKQWARACNISG